MQKSVIYKKEDNMKYAVFVFILLPVLCYGWSSRVMSAMLDTFWQEYDWEHDYGINKKLGEFPRLYKFYLGSVATMYYNGELLRYRAAKALARWDVLILQFYWFEPNQYDAQREMIDSVRMYHPDIKILMYLPGGAVPPVRPEQGDTFGYLRRLVFDSINAHNWWIKKPDGTVYQSSKWWKINYYKYHEAVIWMRNFIVKCLKTFPYFNGVMLDLVYGQKLISNWRYVEDSIDIDENGIDDWIEHGDGWVIERVEEGLCSVLVAIRDTMGDDFIITGNSGYPWYIHDNVAYDSVYWVALANGNMSEEILDVDGLGQWQVHGPMLAIRAAWQNELYAYNNPIHFMGEATIDYWGEEYSDTGHVWRDRQQMRYTLCICLMTNAYYSYDTGGLSNNSHAEIWWFPEYNCNLGYAVTDTPQYLCDDYGNPYMKREFERGIVLLNATFDTGGGGPTVCITLDTIYLDVTTGEMVSYVEIPQYDGRILLSEWEGIDETDYKLHGSQLEVYPTIVRDIAHIKYSINTCGCVELNIYDVDGRLINTLVNKMHKPGVYSTLWSINNHGVGVASGLYFVNLKVDGKAVETQKLLILK